jgi:periplasmic copper chaperone A
VADKAELHTNIDDNGVMRMRRVDAAEIAPGSSTRLTPSGLHMMLVGLKQSLKKGTAFPLTLVFEKAGKMTVQVAVQGPGDKEPEHEGMGEAEIN